MEKIKSKVSLVKTHGRVGYCIRYWYPIPIDGKVIRVHRGLNTKSEEEATNGVKAMEDLLQRPDLWTEAGKITAQKLYPPTIVQAFYDYLITPPRNYRAIRDAEIELLGSEKGFVRILFAGTTGAGKTTLERQLMGTTPSERFPSTSTSKTTVCDWEIVVQDVPFKAVVTFLARDRVRQYVEDCAVKGINAALNGSPEVEIARRFLVHEEEQFRLNYLLGNPVVESEDDDDAAAPDDESTEKSDVESETRARLATALNGYLSQISKIGRNVKKDLEGEIESELGTLPIDSTPEDSAAHKELADQAFDERLDDFIRRQDSFVELVEAVMDDVESRFTQLEKTGNTFYDRSEWPTHWTFETENRSTFISAVKQFSDNYAGNFGRLLTPVVEGIRIRGRFKPTWCATLPKFVFMDGRGIGHVAQIDQHLPTSFTKRFDEADVILLVDSAKQPMQAGSIAVLRSIIESGQESKLVICTTHLDTLDKTVWPTSAEQKSHLLSSLDNAVASIAAFFGKDTQCNLTRLLSKRVFYLSKLNEALPEKLGFTQKELEKLLHAIISASERKAVKEMSLTYDAISLAFRMQKALQEFHEPWQGILGLRSVTGTPPEHHSRIRALARRLGLLDEDHYFDLQPVASLADRLKRYFRLYVSKPLAWPTDATEEERGQMVEKMTALAKPKLEDLASKILFTTRTAEWKKAYERQLGPKPARLRAKLIQSIFESGAPIPGEESTPDSHALLTQIRLIAKEVIGACGGTLLN